MKKFLFVALAAVLMTFASSQAEARGYGPRHRHGPVRYRGGFTRNHGSYYAPNGAYIGQNPRSIYRYKRNHPRMYNNRGYYRRNWHAQPPARRYHMHRGPRRW
ncbi:MAG: hypothetical protein EOP52_06310 [Sphingobacteriales bacterium]|nr:MAG: hypothetical protein EOP52_06310 [Sphingobacteriales bacterium]